MSRDQRKESWLFHFWLEAQDGSAIDYATAEELFEQLIAWVEARNLQIGGGFRAPTEEEMNPEPFPIRGLEGFADDDDEGVD